MQPPAQTVLRIWRRMSSFSASATSSYFQAFYEQLHAQAYATGDVACALTQSPSYFGLTEAELKEIMAESAEESLDENYRQIMSFVEAA